MPVERRPPPARDALPVARQRALRAARWPDRPALQHGLRRAHAAARGSHPGALRAGAGVTVVRSEAPGSEEGLSFYFRHFLEAEARRPTGMRLLAAQSTAPLASPRMGAARRLLFRLADKRLLEAMHFSDGRELRIVTRGSAYAYRWEGVYGIETTYIPTGNVRSIEWRDAADLTIALVLGTGDAEGAFLFMAANPTIEAYAAYLATLPGMRPALAPLSRLVA